MGESEGFEVGTVVSLKSQPGIRFCVDRIVIWIDYRDLWKPIAIGVSGHDVTKDGSACSDSYWVEVEDIKIAKDQRSQGGS